ncbi:protease [Pseudoalteromonas peptidolytica]|nr:protease [Pseudoalteromonas peptidolytica]NLR16655.1 protease [Pseudoalteromonas peptidolytica]
MLKPILIFSATLLLAACNDTTSTTDPQASMNSQRNIQCSVAKGNDVTMSYPVKFTFTNLGNEDAKFLIWHTPFEGWWSQFLVVEQNGKKLNYQGPMAKRLTPEANEFLTLTAGQSKSVELDLTLAYEINTAQPIAITYNNQLSHPLALTASCNKVL